MGFNVAMDFHPWILGTDHFQFPNFFFASMLPWIFIHGYRHVYAVIFSPPPLLQCCHGFSSMDTFQQLYFTRQDCHASMLPWIFIHGYSCCFCLGCICRSGFNVAMDFHPWIRLRLSLRVLLPPELQCCHGFSSMDTRNQYLETAS